MKLDLDKLRQHGLVVTVTNQEFVELDLKDQIEYHELAAAIEQQVRTHLRDDRLPSREKLTEITRKYVEALYDGAILSVLAQVFSEDSTE